MASVKKGSVIGGKYRLERALAQGGMGSVWVAQHLQLDTEVAVKFMDPAYVDSDDARARFEREAKASAMLKSPNVVQVYDYGVEDDTPYIVMELLEGEDLDARLRREGRLSVSVTARLLSDACKALRRAHEVGLIHRDLKPANLFITRQGDEEVTKVLDFGIAKAIGPQLSGRATKTGMLVGSPYYMSPEQIRTGKQIDHRTDIWSLGVIAFECITGQMPFPSLEVGDVLVAICSDPIPAPSQISQRLSPKVDEFFGRALMRDPEQRFQSTREFAQALTALAASVESAAALGTPGADAALPDSSANTRASDDLSLASTALQDPNDAPGKISSPEHTSAQPSPVKGTAPAGTLAPAGSSLIMQPTRGGRKGGGAVAGVILLVALVIGGGIVAVRYPQFLQSLAPASSVGTEPAPSPSPSPEPELVSSSPPTVTAEMTPMPSAAPVVSASAAPAGSASAIPLGRPTRIPWKRSPPAASSEPSAAPSAAPAVPPSAAPSASASAGGAGKPPRSTPRSAPAAGSSTAAPRGAAEPAVPPRGR
jgi:serine/threonine protein kinase